MRLLSMIILTFLALTLQAQEIREIVTDKRGNAVFDIFVFMAYCMMIWGFIKKKWKTYL